ncbi:hypothetical protein [Paenibacillus marinisediminis]
MKKTGEEHRLFLRGEGVQVFHCVYPVNWDEPPGIIRIVVVAMKMVLIREKIKGEQLRFLTNAIIEQVKEKYRDWPIEA